jgi:hypothetical protein
MRTDFPHSPISWKANPGASFRKPGHATDSDLTDDDIIVRYEKDEIIGFTLLHASRR